VRYLLDTHTFIWFITGDDQLSAKARNIIEQNDSVNYISIASLWEIVIKVSLGKLELNGSIEDIKQEIDRNGFQLLHISVSDLTRLSTLPYHHRDPFDRMLIAHA
jgi:PIN domain nuclease of toxin-antitoxin system